MWLADLETLEARSVASFLNEKERSRARSFRYARDRDSFVGVRGLLRSLLGRYLGRDPRSLAFLVGGHGKPRLVGVGGETLRFNVSHSGGRALLAFARDRDVGVDLERIRPEPARDGLAERFFSSRETAALASLDPADREAAFFACWTRKEAYVKARGEGLSLPLGSFSVTVSPLEAPSLESSDSDESGRLWSFRDVSPGAGWAGTLVVEGGDDFELRLCRIPAQPVAG